MSSIFKITNLLFFVAIFKVSYSNSDNNPVIDSLKQVIDSGVHDTIRLQAYYAWDNLIYYSDPNLDRELNFEMSTICASNLNKQLHPKEELFYKKYQAKIFNNLAIIFKADGNLDQALDYNLKSLALKKELNDSEGIGLSLMNIGQVYHVKGDLVTALNHYYESLKIFDGLNKTNRKASVLNNIGAIYHYQKDYTNAIKFYTQNLEIGKELEDDIKIAGGYTNLGLVYYEQGDSLEKFGFIPEAHEKYDLALDHHSKAIEIFEKYDNKKGIGMVYNNIGAVYYKKGKLDLALDFFYMSLEIKEEQNNKPEMASALANISNIYYHKKKFEEAIEYGERAYKLASESNAIVEINSSSQILYKIYKEIGKPSKALQFHEEFLSSLDSIQNKEYNKLSIQQQFEYEYEKKATADSIVQAEELKVKNAEIAAKNAESEKDKLVIKRQKEQKLYLYGGLGLVVLFSLFMANRVIFIKRQKRVIENQKVEVESQKNKIELQHHQLEETHKEISDSIKYAQRLQAAILPEMDDLNRELKNGFVLFEPKDLVSGDFYWMQPTDNGILFAAADCTGHGVPGAMVSVVCSNALNRAVKEFDCTEPAEVLDMTKKLVIETFAGSSNEIKDGMDIALCKITFTTSGAQLTFAGANNPLWIIPHKANKLEDLVEIKGSKQPIGKYETDDPFVQHTLELSKNDSIYIFSDGYADQFGGDKGKKLKYKTLKNALIEMNSKSMSEQKESLLSIFNNWKGDFEQVDDVTLIGVRI